MALLVTRRPYTLLEERFAFYKRKALELDENHGFGSPVVWGTYLATCERQTLCGSCALIADNLGLKPSSVIRAAKFGYKTAGWEIKKL